MSELEIKEKLARDEFRLRSLAEAEDKSKEIAEEIKAILRKHGASLAEWNHNLYLQDSKYIRYGTFPVELNLTHWMWG